MTQNPEIDPVNPAPLNSAEVTDSAALDQGTYTQVRSPRNESRLELDGSWHQISPRYVVSQFVQNGIFIAFIVVAALVLALVLHQTWVWIPAGVITAITAITLIILPRQARAIGYMLRDDDIVFRKGILWQRMIAVPYGRMQLVDITQGPLDRAFGVSQLKMVSADPWPHPECRRGAA
jgi:membrane protein YdbS with pleckstrin-like domain